MQSSLAANALRAVFHRTVHSREDKNSGNSCAVRRSQIRAVFVCRASTTETIEGLIPLDEICNEFVCKSSPAVEGCLRQIAKDISNVKEGKRSLTPFAVEVKFEDGVRSFEGRDNYDTYNYCAEFMPDAKAAVLSMKMLELDEAEIKWRLMGSNPGGKVDVTVTSTFTLNLISGRAVLHKDSWDLQQCDEGAKKLVETTRMVYASKQNVGNIADGIGSSLDDAISKIFSSEDKGDEFYADPNDPMKFFQQENNDETDLLQIALFCAAVYLVWNMYAQIQQL